MARGLPHSHFRPVCALCPCKPFFGQWGWRIGNNIFSKIARVQEGRRILTSRHSSVCPPCDIRCYCVLKQETKSLFALSRGCMGMFKTYSAGDVLPFKTIKHLLLSTISDSANRVCVCVCVLARRSLIVHLCLKQPWEKNTHYLMGEISLMPLWNVLYINIYIYLYIDFLVLFFKLETGWVTSPSITGIRCVCVCVLCVTL